MTAKKYLEVLKSNMREPSMAVQNRLVSMLEVTVEVIEEHDCEVMDGCRWCNATSEIDSIAAESGKYEI